MIDAVVRSKFFAASISLLILIGSLPFLLLPLNPYLVIGAIIAVAGFVSLFGSRYSLKDRRCLFWACLGMAIITVASALTLRLWPRDGSLDRYSTHFIGTYLKLDGEPAGDADLFEAQAEIWIVYAIIGTMATQLFSFAKFRESKAKKAR